MKKALILAIVFSASSIRAETDRDLFVSEEWRITLELPAGWNWTSQRTYPGLLVSAIHRTAGEGRMTLSAQRLVGQAPDTLRDLVEKTRTRLLAIGFQGGRISSHPSGALILDATAPQRTISVRQATYVVGDIAYVLTLAAPITTIRSYGRAFDDTLRRMVESVKTARPAGAK